MHFRISLHEYGVARTLPPFVDFNRTCQHCQFNYYSISIGVTYADTCRLFFHKIPKTKHKFQFYFLPGMTMSTSGKLMRKKGHTSSKAVI